MRQKRFTLSRYGRADLWRRFKQTDDHRVAERLHAILLLDRGQNADAVSAILHTHPKTLKRSLTAFASGGEAALISFKYVGGDGWLTDEQQQQFTTWLDVKDEGESRYGNAVSHMRFARCRQDNACQAS